MSVSLNKAPALHKLHNNPEMRAWFAVSDAENTRIGVTMFNYRIGRIRANGGTNYLDLM